MALRVKYLHFRIFVILALIIGIALYLNTDTAKHIVQVQSISGFNLEDYLKGAPANALRIEEISQCPLFVPIKGRVYCGVEQSLTKEITVTYADKLNTNITNQRPLESDFYNVFPEGRIADAEVKGTCVLWIFCSVPKLTITDINNNNLICSVGGFVSEVEDRCIPGMSLVQSHTYKIKVDGAYDKSKSFVQFVGRQPRLWYSSPNVGQEAIPIPGTEGCKFAGWTDKVKSLENGNAVFTEMLTPTVSGTVRSGASDAKAILEEQAFGGPLVEQPSSFAELAPEYFAEIPESSIYKEGTETKIRIVRYGTAWEILLNYRDEGKQITSSNIWYENGVNYAATCDESRRAWYGFVKEGTEDNCAIVADSQITWITEADVVSKLKTTFCCRTDDCLLTDEVCSNGACVKQGTKPVSDSCLSDNDCRGDPYPSFGTQAFESRGYCDKTAHPYVCACPTGGCLAPIACDPDYTGYAEGSCCHIDSTTGKWKLFHDRDECGLLPIVPDDCRATFGQTACCNIGDGINKAPQYTVQACEGEKLCCGGEDGVGECKDRCGPAPSKTLWEQFVEGIQKLLGVLPTVALVIAIILVIIVVFFLLKAILPWLRLPGFSGPGGSSGGTGGGTIIVFER